jgi:hypothetical protein
MCLGPILLKRFLLLRARHNAEAGWRRFVMFSRSSVGKELGVRC